MIERSRHETSPADRSPIALHHPLLGELGEIVPPRSRAIRMSRSGWCRIAGMRLTILPAISGRAARAKLFGAWSGFTSLVCSP